MKKWKDADDVIKMIHELPSELKDVDREMSKKPNFDHYVDTNKMIKKGNCKIKTGASKKLGGIINFGRGKNYEYKFLSKSRALIYKKGIEFIINDKEFSDCFEINK